MKEHVDFRDEHNIHFVITCAKIEFNLCHFAPFSDDEIYKVIFTLNNLFKITSLQSQGWDEHFIYKLHIVADCYQFMSTFGFANDIDFNVEAKKIIVQSNIVSL